MNLPAHLGQVVSGECEDGRRVFWGNAIDRIVKVDFDTYTLIDEYPFPGAEYYTETRADASIAKFEATNDGFFAVLHAFREASKLRDLANLYTVLDRDHTYYIGGQRYNVMYSGTAIDEDGRIHYGTPWGRVRLTPKTTPGK